MAKGRSRETLLAKGMFLKHSWTEKYAVEHYWKEGYLVEHSGQEENVGIHTISHLFQMLINGEATYMYCLAFYLSASEY